MTICIEADVVTAGRACEQCGIAMPFGHARMRANDGRLLCNGCHPDGHGPGEGRPVGHHGMQTTSAGFLQWLEAQVALFQAGGGEIPKWFIRWFPGHLTETELESGRWGDNGVYNSQYAFSKRALRELVCNACGWEWHAGDMESTCERCGSSRVHLGDDPFESNVVRPEYQEWYDRMRAAMKKTAARDWRIHFRPGPDIDKSTTWMQRMLMRVHPMMDNERIAFYKMVETPHLGSQEWVLVVDALEDEETSTKAVMDILMFTHNAMERGDIDFYHVEGAGYTPPPFTARKVAHDSGDGERIFHCPMCGSGKVTGRSDGTIECGFCQQHFTVQIQPPHPGVPQTIEGEPYEWPGQPEGTFDPTEETAMDPTQEVPPGGEPKLNGDKPEDDKPKGEVPPQFAKGSLHLVTEAGVALPEDSYVRHLAIRYADDPQRVIAEVRASR